MQHLSLTPAKLGGAIACVAFLTLTACVGGNEARAYHVNTGGTAARGMDVIRSKSCGSCHTIPGINGAHGLVGPPLVYFSRRTYIAGELPNKPENLVRWVMSPQSVEENTAMPNLGLNEQQARDIAAYLYTLE